MSRNSSARPLWRALLLALTVALLPGALVAQTGRVTGRVVDEARAPVAGASVTVLGTRLGALSGANGQFTVAGLPAGTHQLRVQAAGFAAQTVPVSVPADGAASVEIALQGTAVELGGIVVSASRRPERVTDAPATVTQVTPEVIENSIGHTWAAALKEVKGLDFIQVGMTNVAVNARGFNSSFNNRMLMMEDGRIAVLPENGLPVGGFTAVPKVDLAGAEVLVGPGAALYGADASSGVITMLSKDPRQFPGTTVEVTGGNRRYMDVQARHAGVVGKWGYKASGEFQQADDWDNFLAYNISVPGRGMVRVKEDSIGANSIDWGTGVVRGTASLVRYFDASDGRLEFSAGASESDGVGQTNVGRNQLRGWGYNFAQARFSNAHWYLNAYRAQSTSGESFAVNRYADAFARNPSLSADSLRMLSDWPSDGRIYAAELQNNFTLPALLGTRLVWGGQFRKDVISSDRQWLTDRLTGEDIDIDQFGVYAQSETPLLGSLNLVLAGRYDNHENYDAQFSPKAALVFKPWDNHALRVSYNRAFKSPTTLQTNFHIPDWTAVVAIFGNTEGFRVQKNNGGEVTYAPLKPETNTTWEAGYKAVIGNRMFVDVAGYYSKYQDFLSPLAIIADPFGLRLAGDAAGVRSYALGPDGQRLKNHNGIDPIVLTYYNLGEATLYGTDAGANVYLTDRVNLKGTFSWLKADKIEVPTGREEATSLNSPNLKWTLGADVRDVGPGHNAFGGFSVRHVNKYYFRSGINRGVIPTFSTLDLNLGYRIPRFNSTLNLGVSNLFTCSQNDDKDFAYTAASDPFNTRPINKERECGFGLKHQEMINMPRIGTMVFLGMRYHLQ